MGMAASQARFLGLTARKNNVEYEGQQINQQRTALSNTSASHYTDLLGMSVPVARLLRIIHKQFTALMTEVCKIVLRRLLPKVTEPIK